MQTQNQHLLQQVTERDDYNLKVCLVIVCIDASLLCSAFFVFRQFCSPMHGLVIPNFFMRSLMQLVSESVKTKQAQSALLSEKQALEKQLQQINASIESLKMRISHSEEQVRIPRTQKGSLLLRSYINPKLNNADGALSDRSH